MRKKKEEVLPPTSGFGPRRRIIGGSQKVKGGGKEVSFN